MDKKLMQWFNFYLIIMLIMQFANCYKEHLEFCFTRFIIMTQHNGWEINAKNLFLYDNYVNYTICQLL